MAGEWKDSPEAAARAGQKSRKHGMKAVEARGREALDPAEVQRLEDLRELLATEPGRMEVRGELAARVAIIVERGFQWLGVNGEEHFAKGTGPLKYLGVYSGLLARLLDNWPELDGGERVIELERIQKVLEDHDGTP